MSNYLLPKARNMVTGQSVAQQDLTGYRFQPHQRDVCQMMANRLAEQMTERTGVLWKGYCEAYTATAQN